MDFELDGEMQMFRESVHEWVEKEAPKDWARELERKEHEYPFELWDKLSAAGFHAIGIPEEYGGEGVTIAELPKLGMRSMGSCEVGMNNVLIPDALVLGEPGKAWYMLLPTLNNERIVLAAFCCGILDGVLEDALAYMQQREAFGKKIGQFQILQHYVADIAMWQAQAELMVLKA